MFLFSFKYLGVSPPPIIAPDSGTSFTIFSTFFKLRELYSSFIEVGGAGVEIG